MLTRWVGASAASTRRAAAMASGAPSNASTAVGSPRASSAASRAGTVTSSVTYVTLCPSRRSARPRAAVPGGPSVSGWPGPTVKPVVRRVRRPRESERAAAAAPPRTKKRAMPRWAGSRASRRSIIDGPALLLRCSRRRALLPRVRLGDGEDQAHRVLALLVEDDEEALLVEEGDEPLAGPDAVRHPPALDHRDAPEDERPGLERQQSDQRRLEAAWGEEAEVHGHPHEPLRRPAPLVDPSQRVVALDLRARLLRGSAVALAYLLERADAGLDGPPLRGPRRPGQTQEQRQEQEGARHQLAVREDLRDLVLGEARHGPGEARRDEAHTLGRRRDPADGGARDAGAAARDDAALGIGRVYREQERTRGDGAERIEPEGLAQGPTLVEHGDPFAIDADADLRRLRQLPAGRRQPAFGRVVHGVYARRPACELRLREHADAGSPQELARAADHVGADAAARRLGAVLARQDGGTLERHALGEQERIALSSAGRRHEPVLVHLAQHAPHHDGPRQPRRHLGMAADERHLQLDAGLAQLGEEALGARLTGPALGQEQRGEEPQRPRAAHREVIGLDAERLPAHLVGGEGDRIRRGDEVAVAHVEHGRVLAHARSDDDARTGGCELAEQPLEELGLQLPHRKRRHKMQV